MGEIAFPTSGIPPVITGKSIQRARSIAATVSFLTFVFIVPPRIKVSEAVRHLMFLPNTRGYANIIYNLAVRCQHLGAHFPAFNSLFPVALFRKSIGECLRAPSDCQQPLFSPYLLLINICKSPSRAAISKRQRLQLPPYTEKTQQLSCPPQKRCMKHCVCRIFSFYHRRYTDLSIAQYSIISFLLFRYACVFPIL